MRFTHFWGQYHFSEFGVKHNSYHGCLRNKKVASKSDATFVLFCCVIKNYNPNSVSTSFNCADLSTPFVLKL